MKSVECLKPIININHGNIISEEIILAIILQQIWSMCKEKNIIKLIFLLTLYFFLK